ncbi:DUF1799 domain-containing protein [Caulobacter segnis]|uniref:Uncharacterized protein n=1 Tax=Caulobacter segnis TaxID=88688 RepID=A0A2W5VA94_9CAUL|nr:DUF1799 domain-containing protein [Caulobacter segnis]PZR32295.1 MAG: hypothetical protein DI526_17120 [Caulobacter segnis]
MKAAGASQAQIDRWVAKAKLKVRPPADFLVHPDNILAVRLLLAMQTQWTIPYASTWTKSVPMPTGLKYEVLETTARLAGLGEISPDDFMRLRILEAEVLNTWSEARQ